MADPTPAQWAAAVLQRLHIQQTPGSVQALTGWARAEGGHWNNSARFNPLNTTQPMPGAGNTGTQGNIKVYKDWNQGLDATVRTLRNGRYDGILRALQSGNPTAVASAIGQTPWGTGGGLVARTIASTPRVAGVHAFGAGGGATAPSSSGTTPAPTTTRTVGGVDNSSARAAAISQFLAAKGADPVDFALQVRALRDVPGRKVTTPASSTSAATQTSGRKGMSPLLEMFWQGQGGIDVKNGQKVPQGFVSGHTDHVHVAAGPKTVVALGRLAQQMGLRVSENSHFNGGRRVTGGHAPNSYHYKDQAVDVSGDPKAMAHFAATVAHKYGLKVK